MLTVNHKEESETFRKTVGANDSQLPMQSNKKAGNSSYITHNNKANGSPEKVSYINSFCFNIIE